MRKLFSSLSLSLFCLSTFGAGMRISDYPLRTDLDNAWRTIVADTVGLTNYGVSLEAIKLYIGTNCYLYGIRPTYNGTNLVDVTMLTNEVARQGTFKADATNTSIFNSAAITGLTGDGIRLVVRRTADQTNNIFEVQTEANAILFGVGSNGWVQMSGAIPVWGTTNLALVTDIITSSNAAKAYSDANLNAYSNLPPALSAGTGISLGTIGRMITISATSGGTGGSSSNFNIYTNISEMLASEAATNGALNLCLSYWGSNDIGGGLFSYLPGSTRRADDIGVCFTLPTGRMVRHTNGIDIALADFGVVPGWSSRAAINTWRAQACVDECISNNLAKVIQIPVGTTKLTNGLVIARTPDDYGTNFSYVGNIKFVGTPFMPTEGVTQPTCALWFTNMDGCGFYIQNGRSVELDGIELDGPDDTDPTDYRESAALYRWTDWCNPLLRTNEMSPNAAVCVDPFSWRVAAADRYPGLTNWYRTSWTTTYGGTARIMVRNCKFRNWFIGIANGVSPEYQLGESCNAIDNTFDNCFCAYASGQDQTKSCSFERNNVRYAYSALNSGLLRGTSGMLPRVSGGDWIQIANLYLDGMMGCAYAPLGCYGVFGEGIVRLGSFNNYQTGTILFVGCEFSFAYGTHRPEQTLYSLADVLMISPNFRGINYGDCTPLVWTPGSRNVKLTLQNPHFVYNTASGSGVDPTNKQFVVTGEPTTVKFIDGNSDIGHVLGGEVIGDLDIFTNKLRVMVWPGTKFTQRSNVWVVQFNMTNSSGTAVYISNAPSAGTLTGIISPNYVGRVSVGDPLFRTGGIIYDALGYTENAGGQLGDYIGTISAITATNVVNIVGAPGYMTNSSNWSNIKAVYGGPVKRLMWGKNYAADLVAGTNVFAMANAADWRTNYNVRTIGGAIPSGAFITGIDGSNVTISVNIASTYSNAPIFDAYLLPVGASAVSVADLVTTSNGCVTFATATTNVPPRVKAGTNVTLETSGTEVTINSTGGGTNVNYSTNIYNTLTARGALMRPYSDPETNILWRDESELLIIDENFKTTTQGTSSASGMTAQTAGGGILTAVASYTSWPGAYGLVRATVSNYLTTAYAYGYWGNGTTSPNCIWGTNSYFSCKFLLDSTAAYPLTNTMLKLGVTDSTASTASFATPTSCLLFGINPAVSSNFVAICKHGGNSNAVEITSIATSTNVPFKLEIYGSTNWVRFNLNGTNVANFFSKDGTNDAIPIGAKVMPTWRISTPLTNDASGYSRLYLDTIKFVE